LSSIKKLKKNIPEDSEIFSVTRKEVSLPISKRKLADLNQVVVSFVRAENYFLKNFSGIQGLGHIAYPRRLRDQYVKEGLPVELEALGLQDRQWKIALDVAFATIKSSHVKTQEDVKTSLNRSALSNSEKHLVRYALLRPNLLFLICVGRIQEAETLLEIESCSSKFNPELKDSVHGESKKINLKKVLSWLRRRYRELHSKHQKPVIRRLRTYHVDSSMFRFFKENERCYIARKESFF
jgi:hypothetical protein